MNLNSDFAPKGLNKTMDVLSPQSRELAFQRYLNALECGDDEVVDAVLQLAATDATLCERLSAANMALCEELAPQLAPEIAPDAQLVEDLARKHLPMGFETPKPRALTFGDVAQELKKRREIPAADLELSNQISHDQTPLPARVSLPEIRKIGRSLQTQLGSASASSDRFWREFHGAAVRLMKRHSASSRSSAWGGLQPGLAREERGQVAQKRQQPPQSEDPDDTDN